MPIWVRKTDKFVAVPQAIGTRPTPPVFAAEMVGRNCALQPYEKRRIPKVSVDEEIIAYASPDSTFAVTKRLIDAATKTILIGIYDFSAAHVRELLLAAMARNVEVSLMLDIDGKGESELFDDLVRMGVHGVSAPSCANPTVRFFSSSHEKVIVIDGEWTLVQSGNYSDNSIPLNVVDGGEKNNFRTGNRDTGLAVKSTKLAKLFTEILRADMALVMATPQMLASLPDEDMFLVEAAPKKSPAKFFPSKRFKIKSPLALTPVLSPDNYMDVVPKLLANATASILIEQQYVRAKQPHIRTLLSAMAKARAKNPDLDIRIVLGKIFDDDDLPKEMENLKILAEDFGLNLGTNVRYINTNQLVHCHNKMIVVDGRAVLISSQNWSDSAVSKNREAGLWAEHEGLASYFGAIFETDWGAAFKTPDGGKKPADAVTPQTIAKGGFIRVVRADYEEV